MNKADGRRSMNQTVKRCSSLILCFLLLFCSGCRKQPAVQQESTGQEGREEETMAELKVLSKEQAQIIAEQYLQETYNENYQVSLPFRTEDGNYKAEARAVKNKKNRLQVKIYVSSGMCRDDGCVSIVENALTETVKAQLNQLWPANRFELSCQLRNKVSEQEWKADSEAEKILEKEDMQCQLYLLILEDQPDQRQEAEKIKQLIDSDCMKNLHLNLDVYYAAEDVFAQSCAQMDQNQAIRNTICDTRFSNYVTVNAYTNTSIGLEEIIHGFIR